MTNYVKIALLVLIGFRMVLPLSAQDNNGHLTALSDPSEMVGWEAVGRIDTPNSYCTGTLIASNIVLTAAHCVFDRETGLSIHVRDIVFRAGYRNGSSLAERRVVRWSVPGTYAPTLSGMHEGTMIASDMALLILDRPIDSKDIRPFKIDQDIPYGRKVGVLSYGKGRDEVLSRQSSCDITKRFRDGVIQLDCNVTFGSSGAPVFVRKNGESRIVSVISAIGEDDDGKRYALGMILPEKVGELYDTIRDDAAFARLASDSSAGRAETVGNRSDPLRDRSTQLSGAFP